MKLIKHFDTFLAVRVNLTQARLDLLDQRVVAVTNFLKTGEDTIAERFLGVIPQGSYAHRTIINPVGEYDEFDADVLLELEENTDWSAKDYVEELYKAFRASGTYRDMVSRHARCVKVDYANEFHIDVVPYLERHGDHYITNRDDDIFELTNPEGFNEWLDEQNRIASGRLIKVVRLFKYLRDHKNTFSIKSVILNILLGGRVNSALLLNDAKYYADVPTAFVHLVADLNEYLQANPQMPNLTDPSCPTQNFNHRWNQEQYANFRKKVKYYSDKANEAFNEEDRDQSIRKWREIFGDDFAATATVAVSKATQLPLGAARNTEQFITDLGFPEVLQAWQTVRIEATVLNRPGFRPYNLRRHANVVGRNRQIRFRVVKCTVPEPYGIYWKVRNTGPEAIAANCIRGQVEVDDGSRSRVEPTAYRGKHYVECYVVKNGVCVAKDHQVVVIK